MRDLDDLFSALKGSRFRQRMRLNQADADYLRRKSLSTVLEHAEQFIRERLAPAQPKNDGKQTPMRGHPVFPAQHATGTCCRGCLAKWHHIEPGRELTEEEIFYILDVLQRWLSERADIAPDSEPAEDPQRRLF